MNKKILAGVSALAAGAIGTGVYLASPASAGAPDEAAAQVAAAAASDAPADRPGRHPGRRFARVRGIHGQATVRTKDGFAQVDWQRGTLTATSGGTLTVRSLDGTTWQWKTDDKTRVRKGGERSEASKLAVGDFVVVAGPASGGRTARVVLVPRRVPPRATQSPAPAHS